MKKVYVNPKAEKLEFNYSEVVVASAGCGGIYQEYTETGYGCDKTPTGRWVHPFSDAADAQAKGNQY